VIDWRDRLRLAIARSWKKESVIALDAGIAPATLSRVKNGSVQPAFDTVVRIAHATDVRVAWLLAEPGFEFSEQEIHTILTAGVVLFDVFSRTPHWREDVWPGWRGRRRP